MSRPRRLDSIDYRGFHRYFLTICAHERRPIFKDPSVVDLVTDQIRYTSVEQEVQIVAYCFMSDHLHMLVVGTSASSDLRAFATRMKQRAGWRFGRRRDGKLWQSGYHDRVLRTEEATRDIVRYIIENPIRAGAAKSPGDYPFWGSCSYTREELLEFVQDDQDGRT